ncbi:MAG: hypothetical protein ACI9W2_001603 [Gammaproteobacteria bacterium]|jgi:hypothetical protein
MPIDNDIARSIWPSNVVAPLLATGPNSGPVAATKWLTMPHGAESHFTLTLSKNSVVLRRRNLLDS